MQHLILLDLLSVAIIVVVVITIDQLPMPLEAVPGIGKEPELLPAIVAQAI